MTEPLTKKEIQSIQTKNELIEHAYNLFRIYGFENTSIATISKEASVTRGAFYWHFDNKESIYCETIYAVLDKINNLKYPIYNDASLPFEDKVVQVIEVSYKYNDYFKYLMQVSMANETDSDILKAKMAILEAKEAMFTFFKEGIEELQRKSNHIHINSGYLASMLYGYFESMYTNNVPSRIKEYYNYETIYTNIQYLLHL